MSLFHEVGNSDGIRCSCERKPERKPLRLLVLLCVLMFTLMLCGCGASKYESVDLSLPGTSVNGDHAENSADFSANAENPAAVTEGSKPSIVLGGTMVNTENDTVNGAGKHGQDETGSEIGNTDEASVYHGCDDYVIVTADTLNVREADNTKARIYIQLATGEVLHRIGYNEEWCQIEYDGGVAYVAADMVEITESPVEETIAAEEKTIAAEEETIAAEEETIATEEKTIAAEERTVVAKEETMMAAGKTMDSSMYQKTGMVLEEEPIVPLNGHVVAIDAGHQAKANAEKEPIGPASQTKKAKMPEGAVGTVSGVKEYELTLVMAKQLASELKSRGYEVVMVRESHDVNLSEAERSKIANESEADIFIRLHANSMENSSIYGAMAMCMTEYNPYNSELSADSYRLSKQIINNICANTGTKNRGVQKVDNSSSINWCELPVSVVEIGFLSNPDEDRWLQEEEYQKKIITGISDAVDTYFGSVSNE